MFNCTIKVHNVTLLPYLILYWCISVMLLGLTDLYCSPTVYWSHDWSHDPPMSRGQQTVSYRGQHYSPNTDDNLLNIIIINIIIIIIIIIIINSMGLYTWAIVWHRYKTCIWCHHVDYDVITVCDVITFNRTADLSRHNLQTILWFTQVLAGLPLFMFTIGSITINRWRIHRLRVCGRGCHGYLSIQGCHLDDSLVLVLITVLFKPAL